MLGSVILDVAIGLALVYLLLSLVASAVREGLEAWLKSRPAQLERAMRELLAHRSDLVQQIYEHPLVSSLYRGDYPAARMAKGGWSSLRTDLPSYVPSRNFALALTDIVVRGPDPTSAVQAAAGSPRIELGTVRAQIAALQCPPVQRALLTALDTAEGDLERFRRNVEAWYDSAMDRASGWYKRHTQVILLGIGAALAMAMNVDTVAVARFLYGDRAARDAIVAEAAAVVRDSTRRSGDVRQLTDELNRLNLPVGWPRIAPAARATAQADSGRAAAGPAAASTGLGLPADGTGWFNMIVGWLLTAFAVSLGAPFWFDVLNRISVVRSTVKPHEKSPEEGSKDAPPRARPEPVVLPPPAAAGAAAPVGGGSTPHQWARGDPQEGIL